MLGRFTRSHPLRVWVAGDSLAAVPGQSLERATGSGGAVEILPVESRLATGLGRPEIFNWFERIHSAIGELHPEVLERWQITMPCSAFEQVIDLPGKPQS